MSYVKRRPDSPFWVYDFTIHGRRIRGSTKTTSRQEAEAIVAKLRSEVLLGITLGKKPEITLDQAIARHWIEHVHELRSASRTAEIGRHLIAHFGKNTELSNLTNSAIAAYVTERKARGRAPGTINRELAVLRALLRVAERRWEASVAPVDWSTVRLRETAHQDRYLTPAEAKALIDAAAAHLKPIIKFALLTGLRRANILGLDWSEIDLPGRRVTLLVKSAATGQKEHTLPISDPMLTLLASLGPKDSGPVFTYRPARRGGKLGPPRRILDVKTAFLAAVRRSKIAPCRFHDLRRTAASWMVQAGVPLDVVRDVLGHSDISVTLRYAHRDQRATLAGMNKLASQFGHEDDAEHPQVIGGKE